MHLLLGVLAAIQAQQGQTPQQVSALDSVAIVARAVARERTFMLQWDSIVPRILVGSPPRCHNGSRLIGDAEPGSLMFPLSKIIWNYYDTRLGLCPTWISAAPPTLPDQRRSIDERFPPALRPKATALRIPLIAYLDSVGAILPRDPHIMGQRVRFDVDQHDSAAALRVVGTCHSSDWWCLALAGYVRHTFQNEAEAGDDFENALSAMPDSTRCAWENVAPLLGEGSRRKYRKLSCAQQDSVNTNLWFLADPLYLEPGNERRNEHYARYVLTQVRLIRDLSEQNVLSEKDRQAAMTDMVLRYGWPTSMTILYKNPWIISGFNPGSKEAGGGNYPAIVTAYRWPQVHSLPHLSDLADPLVIPENEWNNLMPALGADGIFDREGWAPEFYFREAGPIAPLETQVAFLRRQQTAMAMLGAQWAVEPTTAGTGEYRFGVMTSGGPAEPFTGGGGIVNGSGVHGLSGPIESRHQLLGVELIPMSNGVAGRARFGVRPPQPLDSLAADSIAVSDLVMVRAPENGEAVRNAADATRQIYGSLTFHNPKTVGLFWEVYGPRAGDTISYSVRAIHHNDGVATSVLSMFGVRQRRDTITVSWTDVVNDNPAPGSETGVQVRGRGINLNVAAFLEGRYTLEVIVGRRNTPTAISRRDITIRRN